MKSTSGTWDRWKKFLPVALLVTGMACFFLTGCSTQARMTVSEPSIYTDDQALKAFAEQQKKLDALSANISSKEIQSSFGARQATQTDVSVSVSPTSGGIVSAPEPLESQDIELPSPPPPNDKIGLLREALLRKKISEEQDLMGWKLKILGDSRVHDGTENKMVLLRFDVSINNYLPGETWIGNKNFAVINFTVEPGPSTNCGTKKPIVYALVPEFTSSVGEESLVTNNLENLALQGGGTLQGVDITGAGRYQRELEEYLQTLVEEPVQFAIYRENGFGFAFGPTRQIDKRSWVDPRRWFGNTYQIKYEIEPGPRDVYALLIVPKCASELKVTYKANKTVLTENFDEVLEAPKNYTSEGNKNNSATSFNISVSRSQSGCQENSDSHTIYPALTNTIFISSQNSVTSETEAMIGPVAVPKKDITIFGRKQLHITIPPNAALAELLKGKKPNHDINIINPGENKCKVGSVTLVRVGPAPTPPKEKFSLDPKSGSAEQYVTLTLKHSELSLTDLQSVTIGDKEAPMDSGVENEKNKAYFRLPSLSDGSHPETLVSVKLKFKDDVNKFLPNVFTYKAKP